MDWQERYQVDCPLSETFKGATFRATDRQTGQPVLVRLLYRSKGEHYLILKGIISPHLPQIYQVFEEGEDTVVVEEFLQGETLETYLEHSNPLPREKAVEWFVQICQGLREIHRLGIIHRDIKPANLFLREDGTLVLIDFDAARRPRQELRRDTVYMGTQGYAPPEQYGFAQTDCRSDIYSLGVVGKELCGGQKDYPLWPILERCTAFDPDNRFSDVDHIFQALKDQGLLTGEDVPQAAAPSPAPQKRWTPTRKGLIKGVFSGLVGLMVLVLLFARQPFEVTTADWMLSKSVYLFLILYPACFALDWFHIQTRAPLLRSSQRRAHIWGTLLYTGLYFVLLFSLNSLAHTLYSPQAQAVLGTMGG